MASILTRLCLAIDSVEDTQASVRFVFAFLRFDFCDARIAFPSWRVRLFSSLTLDAFPVECLSPICDPPCHRVKAESLRGLVNQSSPERMVYKFCGGVSCAQALIFVAVVVVALAAMLDADIGCTGNKRASTPCSHETAPIGPERRLWSQEALNAVSRQPIN